MENMMKKSNVSDISNVTLNHNSASWQLVVFITSSCLICLSVIVFNGYFALITVKKKTFRKKFIVYLLPINISDLLLGFAAVWRGIAEVIGNQSYTSCFFQALLGFISVATSLAMLLWISLVAIAHPIKYKNMMGIRFAVITSCVVPGLIIIFNSSVFGFLYENNGPIEVCIDIKLFVSNYEVLGIANVAFLAITLIGTTIFNWISILTLKKKARLIGVPPDSITNRTLNADIKHEKDLSKVTYLNQPRLSRKEISSSKDSKVPSNHDVDATHVNIHCNTQCTDRLNDIAKTGSASYRPRRNSNELTNGNKSKVEIVATPCITQNIRLRPRSEDETTRITIRSAKHSSNRKVKVAYWRPYVTLVVMNMLAVLCLCPYIVRVTWFLMYHSVPDSLILLSDFVISANSAINPIIFLYRMPLYREHVIQNLSCIRCVFLNRR